MKKNIKNILAIVLFFLVTIIYAQDDTNDFATWNTIQIEYKLNKKWNFGLEEQLRLKDNSSQIDEYFTELTASYKIFKKFRLGLGLRYIRENDTEGNIQGYENHFRFHLDALYKHKLNNFTLSYRLRYQNKNELGISYDDGDYANQNLRLKTGIKYNFKNWALDPKFAAEIFNHFEEGGSKGFHKFRLTLGTDYKIKNFGKLGVFYRYQQEINVEEPETTNILGLKYTYTFKNKK